MTTQQLLKELLIRFDTNPKLYLKLDFLILIKLLQDIVLKISDLESED